MRSIGFTQKAFRDFYAWSLRDKKVFIKINELVLEITRDPFKGTGKPEPLRHQYKGLWSRRITLEHRMVYSVTDDEITIISCEGHYTD